MLKRFGWEEYAHLHKIGRVFTQNPGIVSKRKFMEEHEKRRISLGREMLGHPPICCPHLIHPHPFRKMEKCEKRNCDSMAKKSRKMKKEPLEQEKSSRSDIPKRYAMDFLALRNAIIQNCRDCIRDCGRDCLDSDARPLENIRCPLQKVRMEYTIAIDDDSNDFSRWTQKREKD